MTLDKESSQRIALVIFAGILVMVGVRIAYSIVEDADPDKNQPPQPTA